MILHAMNVIRSALKHVNPVQVPVIAFDQPLFALAKQIQWELPNTHGEDHLVVMFHALHVEMAAFKALGKWLTGSGWTEVLSKAGIAMPGVSDLSLTASHLTKTRRTHQITAAALHLLQHQAYSKFTENSADDYDDEVMTVAIEEWKSQMSITEDSFLTSRILAVFYFTPNSSKVSKNTCLHERNIAPKVISLVRTSFPRIIVCRNHDFFLPTQNQPCKEVVNKFLSPV